MLRVRTAALGLAAFLLLPSLCIAGPDDTRRSMSANAKMIARFEGQRQERVAAGADATELAGFDKKISLLKADNQRLSGLLKAASVPPTERPVSPTLEPPTPPAIPMELPTPVKGPQKGFADLMGEDWWKLSEKDKERFVLLGLEGLDRRGATASHSPYDYVDAMDRLLTAVPEFSTEYLEDLLVFAVYDNEPETRAAIDKIREETAKAYDK